jgi:hypothetical protein
VLAFTWQKMCHHEGAVLYSLMARSMKMKRSGQRNSVGRPLSDVDDLKSFLGIHVVRDRAKQLIYRAVLACGGANSLTGLRITLSLNK